MKTLSGKAGEEHIAHWLEERGYRIVARNFHSRFGEIDIIAQREPYIAFVEVKTRAKNSLVSPFEAITPKKRQKLIATAKFFLPQSSHTITASVRRGCGLPSRGKRLWERNTWKTFLSDSTCERRSLCAVF